MNNQFTTSAKPPYEESNLDLDVRSVVSCPLDYRESSP